MLNHPDIILHIRTDAVLNLKQASTDTVNGRGDGVSPSPMVAAAVREASTGKACAGLV